MNPKLFRAIVVVGAALGGAGAAVSGCRTEMLDPNARDMSGADQRKVDMALADAAKPMDLSKSDLPECCDFPGQDLSMCIPIPCILI